jgi:hypothetical protein
MGRSCFIRSRSPSRRHILEICLMFSPLRIPKNLKLLGHSNVDYHAHIKHHLLMKTTHQKSHTPIANTF